MNDLIDITVVYNVVMEVISKSYISMFYISDVYCWGINMVVFGVGEGNRACRRDDEGGRHQYSCTGQPSGGRLTARQNRNTGECLYKHYYNVS